MGSVPITRYRVKQAPLPLKGRGSPHLWLHRTPIMAAGLSDHICHHGLSGHRYQMAKTMAYLITGTLPLLEIERKKFARSAGALRYFPPVVHPRNPSPEEHEMSFVQAIILGFAFALGAFLFQSVLTLGQQLLPGSAL